MFQIFLWISYSLTQSWKKKNPREACHLFTCLEISQVSLRGVKSWFNVPQPEWNHIFHSESEVQQRGRLFSLYPCMHLVREDTEYGPVFIKRMTTTLVCTFKDTTLTTMFQRHVSTHPDIPLLVLIWYHHNNFGQGSTQQPVTSEFSVSIFQEFG